MSDSARSDPARSDPARSDPASGAATITAACRLGEVPDFVSREIDRLHGHLLCSLSNFRARETLTNASTYVVRQNGVPITVFLFRIDGETVSVVSEFLRLDGRDLQRFGDTIFATLPQVQRISFSKVEASVATGSLRYPHQMLNCTEDIVVPLPPTVADYEARLGKNMRRNIKRYGSRLQQDFPSYDYQVCIEQQISEHDIREIIRLNHLRMSSKSIVSRIDEAETKWVIALARERGIVGVVRIDGKVCGGAIGFRIGDNYFMHIIAHDPAFNDYSLGILCYYYTICEGIARGGKAFHLLPGRYAYKYRLLGENRDIVQLDLYRSRFQMLRQAPRVLKAWGATPVRRAKLWVLESERRHDAASRAAAAVLRFLRSVRRGRGHFPLDRTDA